MRYPEFLKEKGRIGFIAPSFGCATSPYEELFKTALLQFEKDGYTTVLGPNCFLEEGIGKSNTPEACGAEINDFFLNDRSDCIISCGGGETMCEDLPYVRFDKITEAVPKWYMGYSDNTNLTFLLNTICDTASIYGPNAAAFGELPRHKYIEDAFLLLTGAINRVSNYDGWLYGVSEEEAAENPDDIVVFKEKYYRVLPYEQKLYKGEDKTSQISFSGRLVGGCLDCLAGLVGTKFDKVTDYITKYKNDGIIWFLEACDLNVMSIRRSLWQLEQAGWFENVSGFIIGRPLMYNDTFGDFDHIEAVRGILGRMQVPIVMDTDLGHLAPSMPIVSGALAKVDAKGNNITITYDYR